MQEISFQKLKENALLPTRGSSEAAGLDLYAAETVSIPARQFALVSTGIAVAIPHGYYGRVAPRSGLAAKHGIDTLAGVVDSDYRGEISVVLMNHGDTDVAIQSGDRIAQFVIEKILLAQPVWHNILPGTDRGEDGFGSTGK